MAPRGMPMADIDMEIGHSHRILDSVSYLLPVAAEIEQCG